MNQTRPARQSTPSTPAPAADQQSDQREQIGPRLEWSRRGDSRAIAVPQEEAEPGCTSTPACRKMKDPGCRSFSRSTSMCRVTLDVETVLQKTFVDSASFTAGKTARLRRWHPRERWFDFDAAGRRSRRILLSSLLPPTIGSPADMREAAYASAPSDSSRTTVSPW